MVGTLRRFRLVVESFWELVTSFSVFVSLFADSTFSLSDANRGHSRSLDFELDKNWIKKLAQIGFEIFSYESNVEMFIIYFCSYRWGELLAQTELHIGRVHRGQWYDPSTIRQHARHTGGVSWRFPTVKGVSRRISSPASISRVATICRPPISTESATRYG